MVAVKGFVLAAGLGERLRPITETLPKPLLPVGNLPLVGYALKLLAHHGITEVILNVHHLAKQIKDALGDGSAFGVQITYSEEEEILGTGGGLKRMHEHLTETFVVLNSDTLIDVDLQKVIEEHRQSGALATMVLREDAQHARFGQIEIDDSTRIRRVLGQGDFNGQLRPLMFTGVHVMEPQFLDYIPPEVKTCVNRYAYTKALSNGDPLQGFVYDGFWADAGTPERYLQVNFDALDRKIELDHVSPLQGFALTPTKDVAEVVRMGEDVQLGNNARIVPPVLLGDGVRVGDNAVVGPYCVVGSRSSIAKEAKLSRAVVMAGSKVEGSIERAILSKKGKIELSEVEEQDRTG